VSILYARVSPQRLNFVLTHGDTLWACRCVGSDAYDPLRFYPGVTNPPSPYWVVCSTVVGSDSLDWGTFPALSVGMFLPGRSPVFAPLAVPGAVSDPDGGADPPGPGDRSDWLGAPRPNPTGGPVLIPVGSASLLSPARVEIWSASGALVWEDGEARPIRARDGQEFLWPGCDRDGRAVPPGVYFCRVRAGGLHVERKITVVR
jgi:hypothetical protein